MHLITHPDEYPYPGQARPQLATKRPSTAALAPQRAARMEPLLEAPSVAEEFQGLLPEQTAERIINRLAFHYRRLLDVDDFDLLRQAILASKIDAVRTLEDAMGAVARVEKDAFAQQLKTRLGTAADHRG